LAVYTQLSAQVLGDLIAQYDVGDLVSAKGIAEGVSNSNWLIETTQAHFILTMYERRIETRDLPYFLGLLDHLSAKGSPVPRTIHDSTGAAYRMLDGKAVALIEFLPGISVDEPSPEQARNVGKVLAQMHLRAMDYPATRANDLGPAQSAKVLQECGPAQLHEIAPGLEETIEWSEQVAQEWPNNLPESVIHTDLFPDNVLMRDKEVSGLIDFYFACNGPMAYDLAVTHAAWSFDATGVDYQSDVGQALIEGYESVRPLEGSERAALPLLAQAAALRFVSSRAQDWLDTPADALVTRKDPMDFVRRLQFYQQGGQGVFSGQAT